MDAEHEEVAAPFLGDPQDFVVRLAGVDDLFHILQLQIHDGVVQLLTSQCLRCHPVAGEIGRRSEQRIVGHRRPLHDVEGGHARAARCGQGGGIAQRRERAV